VTVCLLVFDRDGTHVHLDILADDLEDLLLQARDIGWPTALGAIMSFCENAEIR
jgi:hypothetical protein